MPPKSPISCYAVVKRIGCGFITLCAISVLMTPHAEPGRSRIYYLSLAGAGVILVVCEVLGLYFDADNNKDDD